jgi:predicted nucleic acid-binding protein
VIVVADTSPLNYLIQIGYEDLLPRLYERIILAQEQHADLLLIDERKGRLEAMRRGLMTTGTLGVLLSAGELKLIDPKVAYHLLLGETTFRTSAALETQFLGKIRTI